MKCIFLLVCLVLIVNVFLPVEGDNEQSTQITEITIKTGTFAAKPDYMQLELVDNRPLLIIKYSDADKACLDLKADDSWFVAWAQGSDLACPLKRVDADTASQGLGYPVCRGLQDQCRGSLYNLQGQVYPNQLATKNLHSPVYAIQEEDGKKLLHIKHN